MSGFPILDLVIGMIFIYFLLSIICSSATELWFSMLRTRARLLEQWVKTIFDKPSLDSQGNPLVNPDATPVTLGQAIIDHCLTTGLSKKGKSTTYISAENFVSALLDKITIVPVPGGTSSVTQMPPGDLTAYTAAIANSQVISGELKRTFLAFANEAKQAYNVLKVIPGAANAVASVKSELDLFRDRIESWYNASADRLTGKLKRTKVMPTTFVLAILITVSLNTDSIELSKYLYSNKEASKQLATTALDNYQDYKDRIDTIKKKMNETPNLDKETTIKDLDSNTIQLQQDFQNLKNLDLPLGWKNTNVTDSKSFWKYILDWKHIAGWLATILAICMGAPFWFDILNKIANLRSNGPKPAVNTTDDNAKNN